MIPQPIFSNKCRQFILDVIQFTNNYEVIIIIIIRFHTLFPDGNSDRKRLTKTIKKRGKQWN